MPPWGLSLQSVLPLGPCERFVDSRPLPPHALGGIDVPTRLRLEVLRNRGIGWPLSGLPALLGFCHLATVAASRGVVGEGGLMVSPHGSPRVRASNRSKPSPQRLDTGVSPCLTPPFIGERL